MSTLPRTGADGWPRVTQVLRDSGLVDVSFASDEARDRGTALHAATHYWDEGELDVDTLDPRLAPAFAQYQRFLAEVKPEILGIEEEVANETYRYRGRLDRRVVLDGREGIVDIKGAMRAPWQGVQLAGYAACFPRPLARWALHLTADRYQLIEHADRDDWRVFQAALTLVHWKARHGL